MAKYKLKWNILMKHFGLLYFTDIFYQMRFAGIKTILNLCSDKQRRLVVTFVVFLLKVCILQFTSKSKQLPMITLCCSVPKEY